MHCIYSFVFSSAFFPILFNSSKITVFELLVTAIMQRCASSLHLRFSSFITILTSVPSTWLHALAFISISSGKSPITSMSGCKHACVESSSLSSMLISLSMSLVTTLLWSLALVKLSTP